MSPDRRKFDISMTIAAWSDAIPDDLVPEVMHGEANYERLHNPVQ